MNFPRGLIFGLVALSLGLSWYFARTGADTPHPRATCLVNANCQANEKCVVVPKGDGFASFGQCGELCTDDAACPNGWNCRAWVEDKDFLSPERGRPAELPRVKVCMHHTVQ